MAAAATIVDGIARIFGGTVRTAAGLSATDLAYAERTTTLANDLDAKYALYQDYYDGNHADPTVVVEGTAHPSAARAFAYAHNLCGVAVDVLVERLDISGVTVTMPTDDEIGEARAETLARTVWGWWDAADGSELQNVLHTRALVAGDAYLVVDYDPAAGRPRFTFHGAMEIMPVYDAYHRMVTAWKRWDEMWYDQAGNPHTRRRLTKYTDRLIEKYADDGRGWVPYGDDLDSRGRPDGGVIDWTANGRPLGIPVVHFRNKARGADFGVSELTPLIAPQDEYNRRVYYTSEAMSYGGAPLTWLANVQAPKDAQSRPSQFVAKPGRVWQLAALDTTKNVEVGQLGATDVSRLQDATDAQLKTFAAIAGVPIHLFWQDGNPPSGESIKTAESRLTAKALDRQTTFAPSWVEALTLAANLAAAFGGLALPEGVTFEPIWASAETRSSESDERVLQLAGPDLSWEERMRRRGYSADEIDAIRKELEAGGVGVPGTPDEAPKTTPSSALEAGVVRDT